MSRRVLAGVVAAVLGLAAAVVGVAQTSAVWTDPAFARGDITSGQWQWYGQVRLSGTTLCLDIPSRDNATGLSVQLYECNSTPAQVWTFNTDATVKVYQSVGQWSATDNPTARCLDVNGSSTAQNVQMQILNCQGTPGAKQKWTVYNVGDGTVQIRSQIDGTNPAGARCLDVPTGSQTQATVLRLNSCTATGRARSFVLEPVNPVVY